MSDGLGIDLSAAASQLGDALNGSTDTSPTSPTSTPVADNQPQPISTPEPQQTPVPQSGGHPAWNEILSRVPQSLHDSIRPTLEQWDKGVQEKLQQVHAQYDPYRQFTQMPPEQLSAAVQLFQVLNTNPELVYRQLAETFGQQQQAGAQGQNADEELYDPYGQQQQEDPRIAQLAQQQEMIMRQMQAAQEAQVQQQANSWLDNKVNEISGVFKQRGIEPDMEYILGVATAQMQRTPNADPDQVMAAAVQKYESFLSRAASARTGIAGAPQVIPPSGAVPSSNFDPTKLSGEDRRKVGAELIAQAFRES